VQFELCSVTLTLDRRQLRRTSDDRKRLADRPASAMPRTILAAWTRDDIERSMHVAPIDLLPDSVHRSSQALERKTDFLQQNRKNGQF
jgi:hypothetical protein